MAPKTKAIPLDDIESIRIDLSMNSEEVPGGCIEWRGEMSDRGYGRIWINDERFLAHRVSLVIHTGQQIPCGMSVCHRCDNPPCVNPIHLFVGTALDNVRDSISKGRRNGSRISRMVLRRENSRSRPCQKLKGTGNGQCKITEEQAIAAIEMFASMKYGPGQIAEKLLMSIHSVREIVWGRKWLHLPRPPHMNIKPRS